MNQTPILSYTEKLKQNQGISLEI